MTDRPTVAVIGAGFSGLLTSVRLLLDPEGPRILLIERSARFGRGAAFSTDNAQHLLNVRATNMSAFVEQPMHFRDWLAGVGAADQMFVTRDLYGRYLQSILRRLATHEGAAQRLVLEPDAAVGLSRIGKQWVVSLALGHTLRADAVVLALGNLAPSPPEAADPQVLTSRYYLNDPWAVDREVTVAGDILLLGTGLTAVDVALTLTERLPKSRVFALSRHGLRPKAHSEAANSPIKVAAPQGSPRDVLAQLRGISQNDWRAAVDGLRPHVQGLWRGWDLQRRESFLRHLRPWWEVHRHRLAPSVATHLYDLERDGRFTLAAGRLKRLTLLPDGGVEADWLRRGGTDLQTARFGLVVNCSGPRGDLAGTDDVLIRGLFSSGLARADACQLGLDVDGRGRIISADGAAVETLFAVGPLTRGQFYESSSVPDIRVQAADCATTLGNVLAHAHREATAVAAQSPERILGDLQAYLSQASDEIEIELSSLKFARRVRNAWELRGRRAGLDAVALWLEQRISRREK